MKEFLSPYATNKDLQADIKECVEKTSFERTDIQSLTKDSEKVNEVLENIQGGFITELQSETHDFLMLIHSDVLEKLKRKDQELQEKSQMLYEKSNLIESGIAEAKKDMEIINSLPGSVGREKLNQDYQKQIAFYEFQLQKLKTELNEISIELEKNKTLFETESRNAYLLFLGVSSIDETSFLYKNADLFTYNPMFIKDNFEGHIKDGKIYDSKKTFINPDIIGRLRKDENQTIIEVYDKNSVVKRYTRVGRISEDGIIYAGNNRDFTEKRIGNVEEDGVYIDSPMGRIHHKKLGYAKEK